MNFDALPAQPRINDEVDAYSDECFRRSLEAIAVTRNERDIAYGTQERQSLDLFLPADRNARDLPVLFFLHGGGWSIGYKDWCGFMAPAIVSVPAIFVSVGYRLIPSVTFPEPVKDAFAALRWVFDNIGRYGGSSRRIFVGGHSAGAQIAALLTMKDDWRREAGLPENPVRGAFCLSGTYNRRQINPAIAPDHVQKDPDTAISAESPLALVQHAKTPMHIAWGGDEPERVPRTGVQMVDALKQAGCPVASDVYPGHGHFSVHLKTGDVNDPWTQTVRRVMSAS